MWDSHSSPNSVVGDTTPLVGTPHSSLPLRMRRHLCIPGKEAGVQRGRTARWPPSGCLDVIYQHRFVLHKLLL